jgi:hypothetical protein
MSDLHAMLSPCTYPFDVPRVSEAFAVQRDGQTCGAAAIRHGLLLGGLMIPETALEAILQIREGAGTSPPRLRDCLRRLGFEVVPLRKAPRQPTHKLFGELEQEFQRGGFLITCIQNAAHWVTIGDWHQETIALIDSCHTRFGRIGKQLPRLSFAHLRPADFDRLDWRWYTTLVRPGYWQRQYNAWLPARGELLRREKLPREVSLSKLLSHAIHQQLDDGKCPLRRIRLCAGSLDRMVEVNDPGREALLCVSEQQQIALTRLGPGQCLELVLRETGVTMFRVQR